MNGYIKIYRKILDNPIVTKDNDYFRVWIYLLLNATHKEAKALFGNSTITLKPGQFITGREKISQECNISESKTERILKMLKIEQQIEQQTSSKGRLITILNWNEYQDSGQQIEQQVNNKWTTSEQQVDTNNNNKNIRMKEIIKKESIKEKKFEKPKLEEIEKYCSERNNDINANAFYDFYESKNWFIGKNKMIDWRACVRTWEQRKDSNHKESVKEKFERMKREGKL